MAFNFVRFTDTGVSFCARVTIRQRTGQIGFNSGSINRYGIRKYKYAVLYMDEEQQVVGIELANAEADGAVEIKQQRSNTYIAAKSFLDKFAVDYSVSRRFDLRKDDATGFLYFELRSGEKDKETDSNEKAALPGRQTE